MAACEENGEEEMFDGDIHYDFILCVSDSQAACQAAMHLGGHSHTARGSSLEKSGWVRPVVAAKSRYQFEAFPVGALFVRREHGGRLALVVDHDGALAHFSSYVSG